MNRIVFFLLLVMFMPFTTLKAHKAHNDASSKTYLKYVINKGISGFDFNQLIAKQDATWVDQKSLFGFFTSALKAVAVWGGVKLTKFVWEKIRRRASTYSERYYTDPGVQQAAFHWDDLMQRSGSNSCRIGVEPDHDTSQPGDQDTQDCPICHKQAKDFRM